MKGKSGKMDMGITFFIVGLALLVVFIGVVSAEDDSLLAYYPFNGNANDESGNGFHGTVYGAVLTEDMMGNADRAFLFDNPTPTGTNKITNNEVDDSDPTIIQIPNGDILVAYTNWLNGAQIYLTRSTDNGLTWSTPVAITNQYHNIDPYITHTSDGKVWIVWTGSWVPGDFDNYYVTSDDNGQTWSEIKHIPTPENWGTHTTIAEDSNHNVWIMWGDHYVISDDFGEQWSQINQMPSWNGNNPSLFCDAIGRLWIVTWSGEDIRYKVSDDNGQTWSSYTVIVDELSQDEAIIVPEITQSIKGPIWITYHSNINGNREVYCTSSSDNGNTWSNPVQITENPSQDWMPTITSINDEIGITWDSNRDGDKDIYMGIFPDGTIPDLVITGKWLCWPDNCTICYNVTNIGNGTAPACHNTTLYVDGEVVAQDHVPVDLAPGESYTGCFGGYDWAYTPPSDNITVCADNNESLDEFDETNNCLTNIWMCGDVNCDGKVTMSDVRKVFNRYLDPNYPLDLPWAADVNGDSKVSMSDVRKVFNRYLDPGYELECCCRV